MYNGRYNFSRILSYNKLLNMVVSDRGLAKTTGAQRLVLSHYLKTGGRFLWLFLIDESVQQLCKDKGAQFWTKQIRDEFDIVAKTDVDTVEDEITHVIQKGSIYLNWRLAGQIRALGAIEDTKGAEWADYDYIVIDEFILTPERARFVTYDVCKALSHVYESVARLRRNVRILMLANAETAQNEFLVRLGFTDLTHKGFWRRGNAVLHWVDEEREYPGYYRQHHASASGQLAAQLGISTIGGNEFAGAASRSLLYKPGEFGKTSSLLWVITGYGEGFRILSSASGRFLIDEFGARKTAKRALNTITFNPDLLGAGVRKGTPDERKLIEQVISHKKTRYRYEYLVNVAKKALRARAT